MMNLGFADHGKLSSSIGSSSPRKLEIHSQSIRALGGFDISFDVSPVHDGKIQVWIHPSQVHHISSNREHRRAPPSAAPMWFESATNNHVPTFSVPSSFSSSAPASSFVPFSSDFDLDPFLHTKFGLDDSEMPYGSGAPAFDHHASDSTFEDIPGFMNGAHSDFTKPRVRIATRNLPSIGMEGEWEVSAC